MGRGLSQRRRANNYERARQAKSGILPLPPNPEEAERLNNKHKKKWNKAVSEQGTASFRRMMKMKALAEGTVLNRAPKPKAGATRNKFRSGISPAETSDLPSERDPKNGGNSEKPVTAEVDMERRDVSIEERETQADEPTGDASYLRKLNSTADKPDISQLYPKKAMKAKKKEFLQKKKLRRKQDSKVIGEADGSEDESDLEERVMTDQHKPAFGEQAMQPLKINLKRKHWSGTTAENKSGRLQNIFKKQMQTAKETVQKKEVERRELAEAFRQQKRLKQDARPHAATAGSLAALVRRNAAEAAQQ